MRKRAITRKQEVSSLLEGRKTMASRIAQQAVRHFYDQGFKATTMRDIAQACEITPGAIYNHFKSKEELLYKIIQAAHEIVERLLFEALAAAKPEPEDQLRQFVKALLKFHIVYRFEALVSNDEIRFLPSDQFNQLIVVRKRYMAMFEKILKAGEKEGVFQFPRRNKKDSIPFIAMSIASMCVRVANWYNPDGVISPEEAGDLMADLILNAVLAR